MGISIIWDIEHLLIYLFTICLSSFQKCLFRSFVHYSIRFFGVFLMLSCIGSLYVLDINLLSDIWLENIFSQYVCCFFLFIYTTDLEFQVKTYF